MDLTVANSPAEYSHIILCGRMDPHGTLTVRDRFRAETVGRGRDAIVDVADVSFVTSVGIGILVDCAEKMRRAGHTLVLVKPRGHVDEVFRKTGIYTILRCADSVDEARRILAED